MGGLGKQALQLLNLFSFLLFFSALPAFLSLFLSSEKNNMFKSPEATVIADIGRLIMFLGTDELFKGGTRSGNRTAVSGRSKGRRRGGHRQGLLQDSWASFKINRRSLLLRNHLRKPAAKHGALLSVSPTQLCSMPVHGAVACHKKATTGQGRLQKLNFKKKGE